MSNEKNIYQRMNDITKEIGTVVKNLNVSTGKTGSYKAVSEVDILNAVKPLEEKYGIYSYPEERQILDNYIIENDKGSYTQKQQFMRIEVVYVFVNVDKPSEMLRVTSYGDGVDSQDKAPGKAMTYADKYALMKAYKISTGDDPDKDASEPLMGKVTKKREALEKKYTTLRTKLSTLNVDFREDKTTVDYILKVAKVKSQNNAQLNDDEMERLVIVYEGIIANKEKEKKEEKSSSLDDLQ